MSSQQLVILSLVIMREDDQAHYRGDKYKLDNGVRPRPVADDLLYNSGNTYSIPLLLYHIPLGSSIHPDHVDAFHKGNYDAHK